MGWLHTCFGITFSVILFAVFWTGTLTVFDKEIDQWMKPELRIPITDNVSLDEVVLPRLAELDLLPLSAVWIGMPRERVPVIRLHYKDANGKAHEEGLHPRTGEVLDLTDSDAGSEFFFRFHFMLHIPGILGYYIVGLSALAMMTLVVSGIFIHRKIFQEFFTFRPQKKTRRAVLDFHNLTSVVALPFHFIIPFSGLLILITSYFPWSMAVPFEGDIKQLDAKLAAYEKPVIKPANEPGDPVGTLDRYIDRANSIWRAQEGEGTSDPDWVAIFNVNDAKTYVVVERFFANHRVALGPDQVVFDPNNGEMIDQFKPLPIHAASNWLEGLHWIQFDHWPLRWLYFLAGLSGCIMIGSGLVFWIESRIKKAQPDATSVRVVRAISTASITGIILASVGFLIANRLIPKNINLDAIHRHELEIWTFFFIWALTFVHAVVREKSAWREQCFAIAIASVSAVALNWVTTGDHLLLTLGRSMWSIAIMDSVILVCAATALWSGLRLQRRLRESRNVAVSIEG